MKSFKLDENGDLVFENGSFVYPYKQKKVNGF